MIRLSISPSHYGGGLVIQNGLQWMALKLGEMDWYSIFMLTAYVRGRALHSIHNSEFVGWRIRHPELVSCYCLLLPVSYPKEEEEEEHNYPDHPLYDLENYKYRCSEHQLDTSQTSRAPRPPSSQIRCVRGRRSTAIVLSVALASVAIPAVVAAGVGGSLAVKKGNTSGNQLECFDRACIADHLNSTGTVIQSPSFPIPPRFNTSCLTADVTTSSPTSDSTKLSSIYVSTQNKIEFNKHRNTALRDYDSLGVFAYLSEDCIVCKFQALSEFE